VAMFNVQRSTFNVDPASPIVTSAY
jgi:hypothetical protein